MQRHTAGAARTARSMRSQTEDGELEDNRGGSGGRYRDDRSERRRSDRRDDRGWHDWGGHHREREDDSRRDRDRGREADRPSGGGGAGDSLKCTVCGKSFSGPKVLETHCRVLHNGAGATAGGAGNSSAGKVNGANITQVREPTQPAVAKRPCHLLLLATALTYRPPVVCVPQEQLQALMQDEDKLHAFLQENPQMMSEVMKLVG